MILGVNEALAMMRQHLGMDGAYLSEISGGQTVIRGVDVPEELEDVDVASIADYFSTRVLNGSLPQLINNVSRQPLACTFPFTSAVACHVGRPLIYGDGRPFGVIGCFSGHPKEQLKRADLKIMRIFSQMLPEILQRSSVGSSDAAGLVETIDQVILGRDFDVHLQPIFSFGETNPVGAEALCRFRPGPYRSPNLWLSDAETIGRREELEMAVLIQTLEELRHLPRHMNLFVNLSPSTISSSQLSSLLSQHQIERLTLEIAEQGPVPDEHAFEHELAHLVVRGMRIALGNVGSGHSSFRRILRLRPAFIKVDMSLTSGVTRDGSKQSLISALVQFTKETKSVLIAEGIETHDEFDKLRELGVGLGQGNYLARPMPVSALKGWLANPDNA